MPEVVGIADVLQMFKLKSRMSVWRWLKSGKLPQPHRMPNGTPYWLRADVEKLRDSLAK